MSGIRISELNKWSLNDIEDVDPRSILIPVSINGVTGCLRSSILMSFFSTKVDEVDDVQSARIDELESEIRRLKETMQNFISEMNIKHDELVSNQYSIDSSQNTQLNDHSEEIANLESVNAEQTAQIEDLQATHEWETFNTHNNSSGN